MESSVSDFEVAPFSLLLLLFVAAISCFTHLGSHAQLVPLDEVRTLQNISTKLNVPNWSFNQNSCREGHSLNVTHSETSLSNITCDCSFDKNTVCHVKTIWLKGLNLSGVFPAEFGDLSYLQEIDLTYNYISGSIPVSLSKTSLTSIIISGNCISGSIPKEIGDIATLQHLVLEDNQLSGSLPENLGNLRRLIRLLWSQVLQEGQKREGAEIKIYLKIRIGRSEEKTSAIAVENAKEARIPGEAACLSEAAGVVFGEEIAQYLGKSDVGSNMVIKGRITSFGFHAEGTRFESNKVYAHLKTARMGAEMRKVFDDKREKSGESVPKVLRRDSKGEFIEVEDSLAKKEIGGSNGASKGKEIVKIPSIFVYNG
ncbi:probable LRR receptor-like serine/threonine-protein kinase At1g53430 [Malania oleifera]|uniref:probable LRR receptor-like serine/threonine-protein kinase At1g53430 n=1 Tax=Malania oleifera TaxID=397392 RepID=UPI0025AE9E58|nr:probable LRR receptor-like serine/threonine-protein kinase At1g53430 [Malania oleifera]